AFPVFYIDAGTNVFQNGGELLFALHQGSFKRPALGFPVKVIQRKAQISAHLHEQSDRILIKHILSGMVDIKYGKGLASTLHWKSRRGIPAKTSCLLVPWAGTVFCQIVVEYPG